MILDRVEPEHAKFPAIRVQQPAHQPDRGRLAGAVRANEPEHLALAHVEGEVGECLRRAVALPDVAKRERAHWSFNSASTGIPSFRMPSRLSTLTLMRYTSFDRSSAV